MVVSDKLGSDTRPQISSDIDMDKHSKHLSNHELDYINKIHFDESLKHKKKTIFEMTLNEIIENTIKFLINFNNDFNEIFHELKLKEVELKLKDKEYRQREKIMTIKNGKR